MTREKAIKIVKEFISGTCLHLVDQEAIETLIPELKESEDERIRKEMIEFLNQYKEDGLRGVDITPWIAYLEKQKEQKSKFYPGDVIKCTSRGSLWVRCKDGDNIRSDGHTACIGGGFELASEEEAVQFFHELNENGYQWDCIKGRPMKKEQKPFNVCKQCPYYKGCPDYNEQKSAECLKAERDGWYVCIKDFYGGGKKQCAAGELVQAKGGMYMMGEENISEWFRKAYYEEVRDALGSNTDTDNPKKTVWSEEDEEMQDNIICILQKDITFTPPTRPNSCTGSGNAFYTHQTEIDWLKSLPLNLKKRNEDVAKLCSNEWSDEDEQKYQSIRAILLEDTTKKIGKRTYGDVLEWYESKGKGRFTQSKIKWSEEDKNKVAQYLHDRDGGMLWSKATEIASDILDMLRPSWKPSAEHMKALSEAVSTFDGYEESDAIKSLYNQLKELGVKEEPEYYQHFDPDC